MSAVGGAAAGLDAEDRRGIDRRLLALGLPAVGALVADPLLGVVDTAVAGRISTDALGALGLAVAVLGAGTWVFNFLVYGTTSAVARAVGAEDPAAAGRRVAHAGAVALGLGLLVGAVVLTAAEPIVRLVGPVEELVDPAATYLRVRAVGLPLLLLGMVGHGAFRGVGDTRTPLVVVVVANLVNGTLNVVLVVVGGAGLAGIAWATVAAEAVALVLLVGWLRRTGLQLRGHGLPTGSEVRDLLRVSRDLVLRTGSLVLGLLLVAASAARIDVASAAAHQVLFQVFTLSAFLLDAIALAGQSVVGAALGRGDGRLAEVVARRLVGWGLVGGTAVGLLLLATASVVPRLLTDDPAALAAVATAWGVAALVQVPGGIAFALDGVLMGAEDWAYLRRWTMVAALGAGIAATALVAAGSGLQGVWWTVVAMMVARAVPLVVRVRGTSWTEAARAADLRSPA